MHKPTLAQKRWMGSARAKALQHESVSVCRKLRTRSCVDGNGGNVSYRMSDEAVLCTPMLFSKANVTVADVVWLDRAGHKVSGRRQANSETLLHLAYDQRFLLLSGDIP
jgi:L-fuculose-phosphate aldolase